ncbi:bleomycin resistance protein [Flaviramulus sp. BrNp1-15]|uniref:VOC family protein n=1 Tax=Flaviramulus sp. BrNp1-15 TaxID=2916754 RepID=UPI001EE91259|nr:bleomycin resistance protein [Flaviramulus sp. BrNp1-15]ULC60134.1 bleomycin resistance protein [Flaviramulus sp. BrNp1-15]
MSLPSMSIRETKTFYTSIGASLGRTTQSWIDVNLFGHQITFIKAGKFNFNNPNYVFEGKILPSFHFGIILDLKTWETIHAKLKSQNLNLVTESTFLKDKVGEHTSFFIKDPNDYLLEFKSFKNSKDMFNS